MESKDPFEYRVVPRSNWELIRWAVMDTVRIDRYVAHLELKGWQKGRLFLKVFFLNMVPSVMGLTSLLWLMAITLVSVTGLSDLAPVFWWEADFLNGWRQAATFVDRWVYLFEKLVVGLVVSLVVGLVVSLVVGVVIGVGAGVGAGLRGSLRTGLGLGLGLGLGFGLVGGFGGSLIVGLGVALVGGLEVGLVGSLVGALLVVLLDDSVRALLVTLVGASETDMFALVVVCSLMIWPLFWPLFSLLGSTAGSIVGFLVVFAGKGLDGVLGLSLGVGLVLIRHLINGYYRLSLTNNIYLEWGNIDISLLLEPKLLQQCQAQPSIGLRLADFLWQYRPKQFNLAALLAHVAMAKTWENNAITIEEKNLAFSKYGPKGFQIPSRWEEQLTEAKKSLIAAETTNLIGTRVVLFQDFLTALESLHKSTQQMPEKTWRDQISMTRRINWYRFYEAAVAAWLKVGREKYAELQARAALTEPIATNRYQTGGALSPAYNQAVFMDREDLKEQLSALLYTTQNFSVFFLQGQRRVGKTSLLKFLPDILGRRFELAYLDLQGSIRSVPDFLEKWQRAFVAHFGMKDVPPLTAADTWAATFEALHPLFSDAAQARNVKIILALDEYEELHTHLAKDPEQGAALLGAIRHFSQHQSEVSLMFVGLRFFSELQNPNWNEYFPQSVPIQVGYLNSEKTFQLLEVSTLDFEEGIKERIYDLSQGHPSLIQKIGYELVQIANREGRRHLTHSDVDAALRTMIYIHDNGVTDIFWSQNCELPIDKEIVRAIVEGKPLPPQSRQRLRRLIEYGFVVEEGEGYRMRVPIFEEWVRRFGLE